MTWNDWLTVTAAILCLPLATLAVLQQRRLVRLESRLRGLLRGASGDLESALVEHSERVERAASALPELSARTALLATGLQRAVQHIGLVRYNPFPESGGDQSFAIALADDRGDGLLLTSLHTRSSSRIYAKPLAAWESPYALSQEEGTAVRRARDGYTGNEQGDGLGD
jgi:hypothetical protein